MGLRRSMQSGYCRDVLGRLRLRSVVAAVPILPASPYCAIGKPSVARRRSGADEA
jgi:hypothetical protein